MTIKFLHLNIWYGKYLDQVIEYINKNDFDIINLQEVSAGQLSATKGDIFRELLNKTHYDGEQIINWRYKKDSRSYESNVILFKPSFTLLDRKEIWLKKYTEFDDPDNRNLQDDPISAISLLLEKDGKKIRNINTHLFWYPKPVDTKYKLDHYKILLEYIKNVQDPFIYSGDFNVNKDSVMVKWTDEVARNITTENKVANTLNPENHKARDEIFPPGLAVDFLYVSKNINVTEFEVVDTPTFSDHLALSMVCEL